MEGEIINLDDESEEMPNNNVNESHNFSETDKFFKPEQIPDSYTPEEELAHQKYFGLGQQSVQFHRLHCSACNTHLGSAPNKRCNRYIHPLLKVLVCKKCFDFYGSGDFDKDEDGSELYCRWCGQGGKVLCCAQCAYVFCQKCIRSNLGQKTLSKVKESQDWLCLVCNPSQIIRHRVMCRALYDYVRSEIELYHNIKQVNLLSIDRSLCCKVKPVIVKRKQADDSFTLENKSNHKKKIRSNNISNANATNGSLKAVENNINESVWEANEGDEVICTPDLSTFIECENIESNEQPNLVIPISHSVDSDQEIETGKPYKLFELLNNHSIPKPKQLLTTEKKIVSKKILIKNLEKPLENNCNSLLILPPGVKYDWLDSATQFVAKVNQNLTTRICSLSKEHDSVKTLQDLTRLHNNLQEILGNSINSLTEIRKNLKMDFITNLKKIRFNNDDKKIENLSSHNKNGDVIDLIPKTVEIDKSAMVVDTQTLIDSENKNYGYIKVKSLSKLLPSPTPNLQEEVSVSLSLDTQMENVDTSENLQLDNDFDYNNTMALTDNNTDKLKKYNLNNIKCSISKEAIEQMSKVVVILETNFGSKTELHSYSDKEENCDDTQLTPPIEENTSDEVQCLEVEKQNEIIEQRSSIT